MQLQIFFFLSFAKAEALFRHPPFPFSLGGFSPPKKPALLPPCPFSSVCDARTFFLFALMVPLLVFLFFFCW